jgi:dTDP-4-dehydrorhamnose reductase
VRVAVTGVSGLLGAYLAAAFRADNNVHGMDRNAWWGDWPLAVSRGDLEDDRFVRETLRGIQPDVLIHCAGTANVDAAEKDPASAMEHNKGITQRLLDHLPSSCLFVYLSTDSVFSGRSHLRGEEEQPVPVNVHAKTKLDAERVVSEFPFHLIIRTNFYGWSSGRKKTAAEWLYRALKHQENITLFDDFFFTPIYAADLSGFLVRMIQQGARGLFHIAGRDRVSKYEFGAIMAHEMKASMDRVARGSIADMSLGAPRSSEIALASGKAEQFLGEKMPSCEDGIRRFLADRDRPLSERLRTNA